MWIKLLKIYVFCLFAKFPSDSKSIADPYTFQINADHIEWPSKSIRNIYSSSGRFKACNILPTRFQIHGLKAVIVCSRLRSGVPITLGTIPLIPNRRVPEMKPFPSWDMQEEGNADAIQNAVDVFLDAKMILWVLDTGWINTLEKVPKLTGRPRVLGINWYTGKILHDVDLTPYATTTSKFQFVVADNSAGRPFLFVSCTDTCSVISYDVLKDKGTVVKLPKVSPKGDILYMVLLKPYKKEPIVVISHMSYPFLFGLSVSNLRQGHQGNMQKIGEKEGDMVILGTDSYSKIFFRWKGDRQVRVWNLSGSDGENGDPVGNDDAHRISTQVYGANKLFTWSLESNFLDFTQGTVGSVGASAILRPLVKDFHQG